MLGRASAKFGKGVIMSVTKRLKIASVVMLSVAFIGQSLSLFYVRPQQDLVKNRQSVIENAKYMYSKRDISYYLGTVSELEKVQGDSSNDKLARDIFTDSLKTDGARLSDAFLSVMNFSKEKIPNIWQGQFPTAAQVEAFNNSFSGILSRIEIANRAAERSLSTFYAIIQVCFFIFTVGGVFIQIYLLRRKKI